MGYTFSWNLRIVYIRALITTFLGALFAISLVGCSKNPAPPSDLLLAPNDFPTVSIVEIAKEPGITNKDEPAVQVELKAPGFTVLESLVLFESKELALSILAGINQDHAVLGIVSPSDEEFDDSSGILTEHLDGETAASVFFVEGRALVKITVSGNNGVGSIWEIARRAREKVKG